MRQMNIMNKPQNGDELAETNCRKNIERFIYFQQRANCQIRELLKKSFRNEVPSRGAHSAKFQAETTINKRVLEQNSRLKSVRHFSADFKPSKFFLSNYATSARRVHEPFHVFRAHHVEVAFHAVLEAARRRREFQSVLRSKTFTQRENQSSRKSVA